MARFSDTMHLKSINCVIYLHKYYYSLWNLLLDLQKNRANYLVSTVDTTFWRVTKL